MNSLAVLVSLWYIASREGSHSGLVRAPAKRLGREIAPMGSNPIPSAIHLIMLKAYG